MFLIFVIGHWKFEFKEKAFNLIKLTNACLTVWFKISEEANPLLFIFLEETFWFNFSFAIEMTSQTPLVLFFPLPRPSLIIFLCKKYNA